MDLISLRLVKKWCELGIVCEAQYDHVILCLSPMRHPDFPYGQSSTLLMLLLLGSRFKEVMTRSIQDALSELCFPFLKEGNSAFIAAIVSGPFPQNEYCSLE